MSFKYFCLVFIFVSFAVSCGDSVTTKDKNKSDNDSTALADEDNSVNDDSVNDDQTKDDFVNDDLADEITVDEDSNIPDDDISEQNECVDGTKKCYDSTQYQICGDFNSDDYTEWGQPVFCNEGSCSGNGECSSDCTTHDYSSCYDGSVYWFNSCGDLEDIKQTCDNGCTSDICDVAPFCGDGEVNGIEACDKNTENCTVILGIPYTGTAECRTDCEGWDTSSCIAETIDPPDTVSASDGEYEGYICISWSAVPTAEKYYIYRSEFPQNTYSMINTLGITDTYYCDYPTKDNTDYYYKVTAYNSIAGESDLSEYDSGWYY